MKRVLLVTALLGIINFDASALSRRDLQHKAGINAPLARELIQDLRKLNISDDDQVNVAKKYKELLDAEFTPTVAQAKEVVDTKIDVKDLNDAAGTDKNLEKALKKVKARSKITGKDLRVAKANLKPTPKQEKNTSNSNKSKQDTGTFSELPPKLSDNHTNTSNNNTKREITFSSFAKVGSLSNLFAMNDKNRLKLTTTESIKNTYLITGKEYDSKGKHYYYQLSKKKVGNNSLAFIIVQTSSDDFKNGNIVRITNKKKVNNLDKNLVIKSGSKNINTIYTANINKLSPIYLTNSITKAHKPSKNAIKIAKSNKNYYLIKYYTRDYLILSKDNKNSKFKFEQRTANQNIGNISVISLENSKKVNKIVGAKVQNEHHVAKEYYKDYKVVYPITKSEIMKWTEYDWGNETNKTWSDTKGKEIQTGKRKIDGVEYYRMSKINNGKPILSKYFEADQNKNLIQIK